MYSQNNLYIPDGEQYAVYAVAGAVASMDGGQRWPLATKAVAQDGRTYRFARAGGSTLTVGDLQQAAANASSDVNVTAIAAAVGARSLTAILTNPTVVNRYAEGYVNVSVTPAGGTSYVINDHAAGVAAAITFNLAAGQAIRNAALTTTSRLDFIANPYKDVISVPVTTGTGVKVGVAVSAPTAGQHCWVQTRGISSVFTSGTLVLGCPAAYIQVARAVGPVAAVATDAIVGFVQRVSASSAWSDIFLTIDG